MSDQTSQRVLPHRKRIGLASAVRLFISIARAAATKRTWGTFDIVFQEGQIVSAAFKESWVSDDQVLAAAGPVPGFERVEQTLAVASGG